MIQPIAAADPQLHQRAARLARASRTIVQACLREEEWDDADRTFYAVIKEGLERYRSAGSGRAPGTA